MTGWGQDGPWAQAAGHDLNYVSITGALHAAGQDPARPHFPTNLLGDFGGGSTYLVIGVLAALLEARTSGAGQVVDAAIVDGVGQPQRDGHDVRLARRCSPRPAPAACSTAARPGTTSTRPPTASTSRSARSSRSSTPSCSRLLGARRRGPRPRRPVPATPSCGELLADTFRQRTQAEWAEVFAGTDACVAPVLPLSEAVTHAHLAARGTYVEHEGVTQPAPAPRFSRTPGAVAQRPGRPGAHTREALVAWGVDGRRRPDRLRGRGAGVKPFLFLGTRAEDAVADSEYDAVLRCGGLGERDLRRHRLERDELGEVDLDAWSGILLGGGPFNVSDPDAAEVAGAAAGRGRAGDARRAGGRGGLPVLRRLLRHRGARPDGRRRPSTGPTASPSAASR